MTINGPGAPLMTVSGGLSGNRVFEVNDSTTANLFATIRGLTITQGQAATFGGGIRNSENLRVENCVIANHSSPRGGGIYNAASGNLTVVNARIEGNLANGSATDDGGSGLYNLGNATVTGSSVTSNTGGGGRAPVFSSGTLSIADSTISGNTQNTLVGGVSSTGTTLTLRNTTISNNNSQGGPAGGVSNDAGTATLVLCTISGNSASGVGGVSNGGTMTLQNCTISGNSGPNFIGGVFNSGTMALQNCTVSGSNGSYAGGVYNSVDGVLTIENCTITQNRASVRVGGLDNEGTFGATLHNSIVADNFRGAGDEESDIVAVFPLNVTSSHNLIGVAVGGGGGLGITNGVNGNQVGVANPGLGPLADNGGVTRTHALLAGGPAIDAGDNNHVPPDTFDLDGDGVSEQLQFDGRGFAFARIVGAVVDIGAFEHGAVSADFDADLDVDGNDFLLWQRGLGAVNANATHAKGNADVDADVDAADLVIWRSQFGAAAVTTTTTAAALAARADEPAASTAPPAPTRAAIVDALLAAGDPSLFASAFDRASSCGRKRWRPGR
jgi:hypothetical protein